MAEKKDQKKTTKVEEVKETEEVKEEVKEVKEEIKEEALAVVEPEPIPDKKPEPKPEPKVESKKNKKLYDSVMTTGSFLASFLLLLIPGLNIVLVILWALGAARNRNKVHFSRAAIIFFLVEVLLTLAIAGGSYIYVNTQQTRILKYADAKTHGLLTYFEVNSFNDLPKLLNIPASLVSKEEPEPEKEPEPIPTRIIVNPEEITSYEAFMKLYNDAYAPKEVTTAPEGTEETTAKVETTPALSDILTKYNVDPKEATLCYIVIDNEKTSCIIAFEPTTGKMQTVPSIQMNDQVIVIGGAK